MEVSYQINRIIEEGRKTIVHLTIYNGNTSSKLEDTGDESGMVNRYRRSSVWGVRELTIMGRIPRTRLLNILNYLLKAEYPAYNVIPEQVYSGSKSDPGFEWQVA